MNLWICCESVNRWIYESVNLLWICESVICIVSERRHRRHSIDEGHLGPVEVVEVGVVPNNPGSWTYYMSLFRRNCLNLLYGTATFLLKGRVLQFRHSNFKWCPWIVTCLFKKPDFHSLYNIGTMPRLGTEWKPVLLG